MSRKGADSSIPFRAGTGGRAGSILAGDSDPFSSNPLAEPRAPVVSKTPRCGGFDWTFDRRHTGDRFADPVAQRVVEAGQSRFGPCGETGS